MSDERQLINETSEEQISEHMQVRKDKLTAMLDAGKNPWGSRYEKTHDNLDIVEQFEKLEGQTVSLAGRIMAVRGHGKASFVDIMDRSGKVQLHVKADLLGEENYRDFQSLDLGDIIGIKGKVFKTKRGEVTVEVLEATLLAKALRPLPDKFHGLKEIGRAHV